MVLICEKCKLLTSEEGRCPCGFTEEHVIKSKDLIPFFERYNETPTTVTFIGVLYDNSEKHFIFKLTRDYKEVTSKRATILYYSKNSVSSETIRNAIQEYQMVKSSPLEREKLEKIIKERSDSFKGTKAIGKRATIEVLTKEYIQREAKKYSLSTARFLSTLLEIHREGIFFSKDYI